MKKKPDRKARKVRFGDSLKAHFDARNFEAWKKRQAARRYKRQQLTNATEN